MLKLHKGVATRFAAVDVVNQADLKAHNTATCVVVVVVSGSSLTRKHANVCTTCRCTYTVQHRMYYMYTYMYSA